MKRRVFLGTALAATQIGIAIGAGLLNARGVLAKWPAEAFHATRLDDALRNLLGEHEVQSSDAVQIEAKSIAEDGRSVPIGVRSGIEGTQAISILSEKNPYPAVATFEVTEHIEPVINARIKMAESGFVMAVVSANGKFYSAKKQIRVVAGGCA